MKDVVIYVKPGCPYCAAAERLFTAKGVLFKTHNYFELGMGGLKWLNEKTDNWPTAPMIFIEGKFYGGFDDVRKKEESGELDEILKE